MPISRIHVANFKGIDAHTSLEIKPITVFIGANSSGKSSFIHALACLSQTVKLPNNTRHLILDDEFANVHLGRFIEAIHSKSYQDQITLGITSGERTLIPIIRKKDPGVISEFLTAIFRYKGTMRTQSILLSNATYTLGKLRYELELARNRYAYIDHQRKVRLEDVKVTRGYFERPSIEDLKKGLDVDGYVEILHIQQHVQNELQNTYYLGPFRQAPQRTYPTRGASPSEVGAFGEYTLTLLANEIIQKQQRSHLAQITRWFTSMGIGKAIDVRRLEKSDMFELRVTLSDEKTFSIADLGYGISQVLPVLTQCSYASKRSTLLFEQPELHLHSLAAKGLAVVFAETVKSKGAHIVIETHSPDLIEALQNLLRSGALTIDDIALYKVQRQESSSMANKIEIEKDDFDIYDLWRTGIDRN